MKTPQVINIRRFHFLLLLLLVVSQVFAAPTNSREWTSTAGTTIVGVATGLNDNTATLKTTDGRTLSVKLNQLIEADRKLLRKHFPSKTSETHESGTKAATNLPHPTGKVLGPIKSPEGSSYFLYLPKSLKQDRDAPLLFYTNSSGGSKKLLSALVEGAEMLGWIMAISIESKNNGNNNIEHCKNAMDHIFKTLPVDPKGIFYTGNSGGGAMAFMNTTTRTAFGVLPNVAYIPQGIEVRTSFIYGLGGGKDFNRYLTANAAEQYERKGFHRMSPAGHGNCPNAYRIDGMIWMHAQLLNKQRDREAQADFESAFIKWMKQNKGKKPKRTYANAKFVSSIIDFSHANDTALSTIMRELEADPNNTLYYEALLEIDKLSGKLMAPIGEGGGSAFGHTDKKVQSAAMRLLNKYNALLEIEGVLNAISAPTVSMGGKKKK